MKLKFCWFLFKRKDGRTDILASYGRHRENKKTAAGQTSVVSLFADEFARSIWLLMRNGHYRRQQAIIGARAHRKKQPRACFNSNLLCTWPSFRLDLYGEEALELAWGLRWSADPGAAPCRSGSAVVVASTPQTCRPSGGGGGGLQYSTICWLIRVVRIHALAASKRLRSLFRI